MKFCENWVILPNFRNPRNSTHDNFVNYDKKHAPIQEIMQSSSKNNKNKFIEIWYQLHMHSNFFPLYMVWPYNVHIWSEWLGVNELMTFWPTFKIDTWCMAYKISAKVSALQTFSKLLMDRKPLWLNPIQICSDFA